MMRPSLARTLLVSGLALDGAALAMAPGAAQARVVVGFGFGLPIFAPAYYPPPVYYPPAPVYYAPPPAYYAQPPAPSQAAPAPQASPASGECREYSSTQIIAGTPQQVFGTACRQTDGSWRIVD